MRLIRYCDHHILNVRPTLTIGNFDGIHKGHQELIKETIRLAKEYNTASVVITFEPHPATILANRKNIRIISLRNKILKFRSLGIDILHIRRFTKEFAQMSAQEFVENILIKFFNPQHIVLGYDFVFGNNREGDGRFLEKYALANGINFTQLSPVSSDKEGNISSSLIRRLLIDGKIQRASQLLGYNYYITGKIIDNGYMSEVLKLPVGHVTLNDLICPKEGIYKAKVKIDNDDIYNAIVHILSSSGNKQKTSLLEIHIFDYKYRLHNKRIQVNLL